MRKIVKFKRKQGQKKKGGGQEGCNKKNQDILQLRGKGRPKCTYNKLKWTGRHLPPYMKYKMTESLLYAQ